MRARLGVGRRIIEVALGIPSYVQDEHNLEETEEQDAADDQK